MRCPAPPPLPAHTTTHRQVRKEGLPDAVLWNPWQDKARALADLGDEDYRHMVGGWLAGQLGRAAACFH